jgi:hypothetical protein
LDPQNLDRFTYATSTTGGRICVTDLSERIKTMRQLRGAHVYPVIVLRNKYMSTNWGGRQRPHLEIRRWVAFGPDHKMLPGPQDGAPYQIASPQDPLEQSGEPATETSVAKTPAEQPVAARTTKRGVTHFTTVPEPSLKEELNDEIPQLSEEASR